MLDVRVTATRFEAPLIGVGVPVDVEEPGPENVWKVMTELLARFGRRRSHARRPGGERAWQAARAGRLERVHPVVDAANAIAIRSGFPISVVDRAVLRGPLRAIALPHRTRLDGRDVGKLPALADGAGAVATPVGIRPDTRVTLATTEIVHVIWGSTDVAAELRDAEDALSARLQALGGTCEPVDVRGTADDPVGRALLDDVLAHPDDDAPRLVFADWLELHGNACELRRAKLIRDQLARRPTLPWAQTEWAQTEWDDAGLPAKLHGGWKRGFVYALSLDATWPDPLPPELMREPIGEVSVRDRCPLLPATVHELVFEGSVPAMRHAAPERVRKLQLHAASPDARGWAWLSTLRGIEWMSIVIDDAVPWRLASAEEWPALHTLRLRDGRWPEALTSSLFSQLRVLDFVSTNLTDRELRLFPACPQLEALHLACEEVTTLAPFDAAPLRELHLTDLPLRPVEIERILAMTSLERISVHDCPSIEQAVQRAIDDGRFPRLREAFGVVYKPAGPP